MSLTLANLKPAKGSHHRKKRVGRGNASGHGTYSGRGQKGQRSRSGGRGGLKLKGLKARLQKVPKLRGFKSGYPKREVVSLVDLEKNFNAGEQITPRKLLQRGLIETVARGVKVLGPGKITKKFNLQDCRVSQGAREQIEKLGGKVL